MRFILELILSIKKIREHTHHGAGYRLSSNIKNRQDNIIINFGGIENG